SATANLSVQKQKIGTMVSCSLLQCLILVGLASEVLSFLRLGNAPMVNFRRISSGQTTGVVDPIRLHMSTGYDLVVIGAGHVGVDAALDAAKGPYNKKVCLIDAPRASGVLMDEVNKRDLSIGAPTGLFSKALRDTSKTIKVSSLRGLGLREDSLWNEIMGTCVDLATSNAEAVEQQLSFAGVHYKEGFASFRRIGPDGSIDSVNVDGEEVYGKNFLIATGSKPFRPKGVPFDGARVFDSDTINTLGFLPKSVAITGSGIIAIEYAKIFKNLGCDVTVLIRSDQPRDALMKIGLDKDVASALIADLVRSGINLARGVEMARMDVPANPSAPLALTLVGAKDKQPRGTLTCDAYLAAVGRSPNTEKLNLAEAGIALDEYGGVLVNSLMATSAR
ncbi:unnamed protein product, partial [Heterosigma akashiwo]